MSNFHQIHYNTENLQTTADHINTHKLHIYDELYDFMSKRTTSNKIKATLAFLIFALFNTFKSLQSDTVLKNFKDAESLIDIYRCLQLHCRPSNQENKTLINELYKMAQTLKRIFGGRKNKIEDLILLHFPDVMKGKKHFFEFRVLQVILLSNELERNKFDFDKKTITSFLELFIAYHYLPFVDLNNSEGSNADNNDAKPYQKETEHLLKIGKESIDAFSSLSNFIWEQKRKNFNYIKDIALVTGTPKKFFKKNYIAANPVLYMINQQFTDYCFDEIEQIRLYNTGSHLLIEAFIDNKYLFYPLCYLLYAYELCKPGKASRLESDFKLEMSKVLIEDGFPETIIQCRKHIYLIYELLNFLWTDKFDLIYNKDEFFDSVFCAVSDLWKNTYFKTLILVHNNELFAIIENVLKLSLEAKK